MAPLKLAIIGGGPSSFYVASRLLSIFPQSDALNSQLRIHIYDRLWAPHGLVRYGVAPDHPEVKVRLRASLHPASHLSNCTRTARTSLIKLPKTPAYASSGTCRLGRKPRQRSPTRSRYPYLPSNRTTPTSSSPPAVPYPLCTLRCHPPTALSPRSRSSTGTRVTRHDQHLHRYTRQSTSRSSARETSRWT